ncbi:MAG: FMN-binding protein [Eubacteriales bacterium]
MKTYREYIAPTVVLVVICLISTLLLGLTYDKTKPVIDELSIQRANEARQSVLPAGDNFTQVDTTLLDNVTEVYIADNGAGVVITTSTKGFGGSVVVMTAFDMDGTVVGTTVTEAADETPGVGTKATADSHMEAFLGSTADSELTVDGVAGATYTSKAVYNGINAACAQFASMGGDL